jgi:hypothetical protein
MDSLREAFNRPKPDEADAEDTPPIDNEPSETDSETRKD